MNNQNNDYYRKRGPISSDYVFLLLSGLLLLLVVVFFGVVPAQVLVSQYRTPILAFCASLVVTAIANVIIGFIQRRMGKEAERALQEPIAVLRSSVAQLQEIHHFRDAGVVGVFPNRTSAMVLFRSEIEREDVSIDFVGTSLRGILDPSEENENKRLLYNLFVQKRSNGVKIRALLMHPAYGEFRERMENRERAAVAKDIQGTLRYLLRKPQVQSGDTNEAFVNKSSISKQLLEAGDVRLYPGVITAFAIFTSRSMLLNVSTLYGPVYDNIAVIIEDTLDPNSIFKRFRANHFEEPWRSEKTVRLSGPGSEKLLARLVDIDFSSPDCRFSEGNWPQTIPDVPRAVSNGESSP